MSRAKRFTHALASGYALLAVNVFYTFCSTRIAVHYLEKTDFGLWAVITQVSGYLLLIDLGMAGSVSRILIDHKDNRQSGNYGSVIQTGFWVTVVQGSIVAVFGAAVSYWLPQLMKIEPSLWTTARQVMGWQCALMAVSFCGRIIGQILQAHQRFDLLNYSQMIGLILSFLALWFGFTQGWGLYSQVFASAVSLACNISVLLIATVSLRLYPEKGHWGRPSMKAFRELFAFGSDLFLLSIGWQLTNASQAMILGRTLGLEAAAVWANLTKTFVLGQQFVGRIFDFSSSALAEMSVRNELRLMRDRFRDILMLSASVAVFAAISLAVCNSDFVSVWLKSQFNWEPWNNWLMGLLLVSGSISRCHMGLLGQTKDIGHMRFTYILEGGFFIGLSLLIVPSTGITGMIVIALVCNIVWSGALGIRRTSARFEQTHREIMSWLFPAGRLGLLMLPIAILVHWLTASLLPIHALLINIPTMLIAGGLLLWTTGLSRVVKDKIREKFLRTKRGSQ